jgi:hypothetical protein
MSILLKVFLPKCSDLDSTILVELIFQYLCLHSELPHVSFLSHIIAEVVSSESKTIIPNERLVADGVEVLIVSSILNQIDSLIKSVLIIVLLAKVS